MTSPKARRRPVSRVTAALSALTAALALVTAVALGADMTVRAQVRLLASYGLKGTQVPIVNITSDAELRRLAGVYISGTEGSTSPVTVVHYPASLWPVSQRLLFDATFDASVAKGLAELHRDVGADPEPVIFGYSQGAVVGTEYKRDFNRQYAGTEPGTVIPTPSWVFIGNPNRPNGGVLGRASGWTVPLFGITFNGPTPTETAGTAPGAVTTSDISGQYDFFSDFPRYPLNLLATANAALGALYVHTNYQYVDMSSAVLQQQYGDTAYYLMPSRRLPLLIPLAKLGVPDPLLAALDAPLRVLIEAGYDRTESPGVQKPVGLFPKVRPETLIRNFLAAIPTGLDDGLSEAGWGRPFGTTPAGTYGVGGPPVTLPDNDSDVTVAEHAAPAIVGRPVGRHASVVAVTPDSADTETVDEAADEAMDTEPIRTTEMTGSKATTKSNAEPDVEQTDTDKDTPTTSVAPDKQNSPSTADNDSGATDANAA